jgi:putative effector of murein hydrolase
MLSPAFTIGAVALTMLAFRTSRAVNSRFPSPLTTPVFLAVVGVTILLAACRVDYPSYRLGVEPLVALLGPATAALAVPLYKHRAIVIRYFLPATTGLVLGAASTLCAAVGLGTAFGLAPIVLRSIGIKSVTAPVAAELAALIGGNPALTVSLVVATGIIGAMLGPLILDRVRVTDPIARGLAFGTIATGIGTAQAATEGEMQGAVAGVAMGVSAVANSFAAPIVIPWLLALFH